MSPVGRAGRESGGHIWVFGEQKMNRITAARAGYTLLERRMTFENALIISSRVSD